MVVHEGNTMEAFTVILGKHKDVFMQMGLQDEHLGHWKNIFL